MHIPNLKFKKGFTLIEILIVISIIGTLAGITTFSVTKSRGKGLDSHRKADLKAIETAAVAYYHDHGVYPPDPATPGTAFSSTSGGNWIPGLENYINSTPKDPKQTGIMYLLASTIGNSVQKGEHLVAGLFTKPEQKQKTPVTPQVAGATSVTINANLTDGWLSYTKNAYPPDPTGTCSVNTGSSQLSVGQFSLSGNYYKRRAYLSFDTSTIPAGSTINSVTLTQFLSTKANALTAFKLQVLGYNWNNSLTCSQWGGSPPTATQVGTINTNNLPADGTNFDITLSNSAVAIGATTYIMLVSDRDMANLAPFQNEYLYLGSAETAGNPTKITVNYTPPVTPSLVGYWKLDELSGATASDSSGTGNTGTVNGTWTPTWTTGKYNNGFNFDGVSNHYINVPSSANLNITGPLTVSAWVKPTVLPYGIQPVVMKEFNASNMNYYIIINTDSKAYFGIKGVGNLNVATLAPLPAGSWSYLTGVYDGTNIMIYLNGVLQNSTVLGYPPPNNPSVLQFGDSSIDTFWGEYNGALDEIRIYNYALTPAQIATDMNNGVPPTPPTITSCSITPTTLTVGQNVTISATIKNNLATAISTQTPDSGFNYTEAQSYSTLGYTPVSGKFRMGVDNGGATYPWRWGFGPPSTTTLAAGASTTITGTITMGTTGTKNLSIGLVEESVAWRDTGKCPTTVTVNTGGSPLPLRPNGVGASTNWTPSAAVPNWTLVDEATADNDTTYVKSNNNLLDLYTIEPSSISGTITGITVKAVTRGDVSHDPMSYIYIRTGGTNYASTGFQTGATGTYVMSSYTWATNPNTGVAWTAADINALQIGILNPGGMGGEWRYLTQEYVEVAFTAPASAPTVTTTPALGITSTNANLGGSANPNGAATTGWFRYSTTNPGTCNDTFGTRLPATGGNNLGSGTSNVIYTQTVTTLSPTTTYYFCAIASNSGGTSFGSILSFTTSAAPTADIKANGSNGPISVNAGDSVSISWTSTGTTTCTVTGGPGGSGTSGSFSWSATTTTTFGISCTGGTASDNVVVNVTLAGPSACPNTAFSYCYLVTANRSSFVIWAQLDNTNDPELQSQPGAKCKLTPPAGSPFNYCIDSSTL